MDKYADLLFDMDKYKDLEMLSLRLLHTYPIQVESWYVAALYKYMNGEEVDASDLANKVLYRDSFNHVITM
jgi:hypothetical protein